MTNSSRPRLAIVSLGTLGGAVLESLARSDLFEEIVVATRNVERAQAKLNNALAGAGIEGFFPKASVVHLDINDPTRAGRTLAAMAPDIIYSTPTLRPWWKNDEAGSVLADAPFAVSLPFHLAPTQAVQRAIEASGVQCAWIAASYPDVVNHLLAATGPVPLCGVGNVAEMVPKVVRGIAERLGVPPAGITVRMAAQHAVEYHCFAATRSAVPPPVLLDAWCGTRDVSAAAHEVLFEPQPIPYGLDFNRLTASATLVALKALLGRDDNDGRCHVPAPQGRLGGWPVRFAAGRLALDLPAPWSEATVEEVNRAALPADGIAGIDADLEVTFTDEAASAIEALTGSPCGAMMPAEAADLAHRLLEGATGTPEGIR